MDITATSSEAPSRFRTLSQGGEKERLSADQQRRVEQLQERDREVRAHEAAHLSAAGGYATGGAQFSYSRGPDGRLYAIGGEVGIDTARVPDDPQATIAKAETIQRAALAPADPSEQDQHVAAQAATMATQARQELARQQAGDTERPAEGPQAWLQGRLRASGALPARHAQDLSLHWVA